VAFVGLITQVIIILSIQPMNTAKEGEEAQEFDRVRIDDTTLLYCLV
jgi:hypothetical protein